jgi:outer membrane protein OmpA-like peptidoglycan-associated protein
MRAPVAVAALAAMLGGCATPSALLLPGEDGHPVGALAVLNAKGETVLDQPQQSASLGRGSASVRSNTRTKPAYQQLMATLPPPARTFTLYFIEGTTTMIPTSRPTLEMIKAEIAKRPGAEVQVTGHTDTLGSDDDNDRLSMKRAAEIEEVLANEGLPREMLSAVGRGERELAVATDDNVANAENRRVQVIVR